MEIFWVGIVSECVFLAWCGCRNPPVEYWAIEDGPLVVRCDGCGASWTYEDQWHTRRDSIGSSIWSYYKRIGEYGDIVKLANQKRERRAGHDQRRKNPAPFRAA